MNPRNSVPLVVLAALAIVGACGLLADRADTVTFSRSDWEARARLAEHLWPLLIDYVDADEQLAPEDRDRIVLALGALLIRSGRIHADDAGRPDVIRAQARAYFAESIPADLVRLTRDVRTSSEERARVRRNFDAATIDLLREIGAALTR